MEWGKYAVLHQMQREGAVPSGLYPTEGVAQSAPQGLREPEPGSTRVIFILGGKIARLVCLTGKAFPYQ